MVADVLLEHHLPMLRAGRGRTLLHWISTLPDEILVERPELAAAGATAALSTGHATVTRQRLLALADRGIDASDGPQPYARAVSAMVRAASIDGSIGEAVAAGRRAVKLAAADPAAEPVWSPRTAPWPARSTSPATTPRPGPPRSRPSRIQMPNGGHPGTLWPGRPSPWSRSRVAR